MRLAFTLTLCGALLAAREAIAQDERADCLPLSGIEAVNVRNIRVMSSIPQNDVQKQTLPMIRTQVQPPVNAGFVGGVIGAVVTGLIVDAVVNTQIQKRVEQATLAFPPLIEEVKDFDFRRQFWSRLDEAMVSDGRFNVLDIATFDSERGHIEQPQTIRGEAVDAVLDLRTEYALTADLRSFLMVTHVLLQARGDHRELYRCRYHFSTPPVSAGEYEAAIALWAADAGALYRAAAVIGMQQTLKMLRLDLTGADAPQPSGEEVRVHESRAAVGGMIRAPIAGNLVDRADGVLIARDAQGVMRAAVEGERFAPSPETVAASRAPAERQERGQAGLVALDDLLGVMEEVPAPEKKAPAPEKKKTTAPEDDLGSLLRD